MLKKLISILLVIGILASMTVTALAASDVATIAGWTYEKSYTDGSTKIPVAEVVSTDAEGVPEGGSGQGMLYLFGAANGQIANAKQYITLSTDKKYVLTGRIWLEGSNGSLKLQVGTTTEQIRYIPEFTDESGAFLAQQWVTFEKEFTPTSGNTVILLQSATSRYFYADDLSVKEVITDDSGAVTYGEELLVNGDFEADFRAPSDVTNLAAVESSNTVALSWVVPNDVAITKIVIYNGESVLKELEPTETSAVIDELQNGTKYTFTVKTKNINDMYSAGVQVTATPTSEEDEPTVNIPGWDGSNVQHSDACSTPPVAEVRSTTAEGVPTGGSGQGMLYLFGAQNSNHNANAIQYITLSTEKKYVLTGRIYLEKSNSGLKLMLGGNTYTIRDMADFRDEDNNPLVAQWVTFEQEFTPTAGDRMIKLQSQSKAYLYADDLSVKEVITDDSGAITYGEELLVNGDFEAQFEVPAEAEFVSVASRNGLNYIVTRADNATEIYLVENGTETKLELTSETKELGETYTIYTHSGLTNGTTYNYVVKTVSEYGVSSTGITVSGTPLETYDGNTEIGSWVFKHNGATHGTVNIENGIGYNESAGMKVTNFNHSSGNNINIYIAPSSAVSFSENSVYKLTFKTKSEIRNANSGSYNIKFNNAYSSADGTTFSAEVNKAVAFDGENADGEWKENVMYLKGSATSDNNIQIYVCKNFENLVFDDFELYEVNATTLEKVDGAVNLITDGDFEAAYTAPAEAEQVYVASRNGANYIVVKTEQPGVEIYQVAEGGAETKLNLTAVYDSGMGAVAYEHAGLTNNKAYKYLVKTVGVNGLVSSGISAIGVPSEAYDSTISTYGWSTNYIAGELENYGLVAIEDGVGVDGSAGMRISNLVNKTSYNAYIQIFTKNPVTLEKDKVYKLTFEAKTKERNSDSSVFNIRMNNATVSLGGVEYSANARPLTCENDGTWKEQICYFKATDSENILELRAMRYLENLVLDNFELYEVDENLAVVEGAVNLIANGDFETKEEPSFSTEFKFYAASSEEDTFGEILENGEILYLGDLAGDFDTDVVYAEVKITNKMYTAGKSYKFILAIYKDNALYDVRSLNATAAYLPVGTQGEKVGIAYKLPDMSDGNYSVKTFMWNGDNSMVPLADECGNITEQ